jgi:hypothetical protein
MVLISCFTFCVFMIFLLFLGYVLCVLCVLFILSLLSVHVAFQLFFATLGVEGHVRALG